LATGEYIVAVVPLSGVQQISKNIFRAEDSSLHEKNENENLVTISLGSGHACMFLVLRAVLLLEGPPVFHIVQTYKQIGHGRSTWHTFGRRFIIRFFAQKE
jgi:hypothetical protein